MRLACKLGAEDAGKASILRLEEWLQWVGEASKLSACILPQQFREPAYSAVRARPFDQPGLRVGQDRSAAMSALVK
jgi:hypothetical protein